MRSLKLRYFYKLTCIFTILGIFSGCASEKVTLEVTHAPQMRMAPIQTIKIDPFKSGSYCRMLIFGPRTDSLYIQEAALSYAPSLRDFKKVLSTELRKGKYAITESENFDARLSGSIECDMKYESSIQDNKNRKGEFERTYGLERRTTVVVKFSVVHKNGESFFSDERASKIEMEYGESVDAATSRMLNNSYSIIDDQIEEIANNVLRKIAPYVTRENLSFASGSSSFIKEGNVLAEKGKWQEAAGLWMRALQSDNRSDRIASLYNLAIYDEYQGKFDEALKKLEQIYADTSDAKYKRAITRIKNRIENEAWLRNHPGKIK